MPKERERETERKTDKKLDDSIRGTTLYISWWLHVKARSFYVVIHQLFFFFFPSPCSFFKEKKKNSSWFRALAQLRRDDWKAIKHCSRQWAGSTALRLLLFFVWKNKKEERKRLSLTIYLTISGAYRCARSTTLSILPFILFFFSVQKGQYNPLFFQPPSP